MRDPFTAIYEWREEHVPNRIWMPCGLTIAIAGLLLATQRGIAWVSLAITLMVVASVVIVVTLVRSFVVPHRVSNDQNKPPT